MIWWPERSVYRQYTLGGGGYFDKECTLTEVTISILLAFITDGRNKTWLHWWMKCDNKTSIMEIIWIVLVLTSTLHAIIDSQRGHVKSYKFAKPWLDLSSKSTWETLAGIISTTSIPTLNFTQNIEHYRNHSRELQISKTKGDFQSTP